MVIKNCPFCGGAADVYRDFNTGDEAGDDFEYFIQVRCGACGASSHGVTIDEDTWNDWEKIEKSNAFVNSIRLWNYRTAPDDLKGLIVKTVSDEIDKRVKSGIEFKEDAVLPLENENDKGDSIGTECDSTNGPE